MDVILTKYGHENSVFFRTFFDKNMGKRTVIFPVKIKRAPIDFFNPKYSVVFTELTFFRPNMGLSAVFRE